MLAVSDLDRARRFYGTERVMEPGQFFYVPPGHDSDLSSDHCRPPHPERLSASAASA
jgi:hypothetical protein